MADIRPDPHLDRARALARLLDSAVGIPGTGIRFGLDPIIGLVPGLGDFAGAALSGYIILTGIRLGASRATVTRMIANVAIDTLVGSVPLLGDLFDAGWKANNRNVALIERHTAAPETTHRSSRALVVGAIIVLALLALAAGALAVAAFRWLFHAL